MGRFSPTVLPNGGQAVGNVFAGALSALEFDRQRKREKEYDARGAEQYNLSRAIDLAQAERAGISQRPPEMESYAGPETTLAKTHRPGTRSPLAMGATPGELADALGMAAGPAPQLKVRAGQFVPGMGFAGQNLFDNVRVPSQVDTRLPEAGVTELGDTGYYMREPEAQPQTWKFQGNEFGSEEELLGFAGDLARTQYPDRFAGAEEEAEGPWEPQTRDEQIAFARELYAARRGNTAEEGDPLLTQRAIADRGRVEDVRDAIFEASRFRELDVEGKDRLARLGGFADYEDFNNTQKSLGLSGAGGQTNPAGGTGEMEPGGDMDFDYESMDFDGALDATNGDVEAAIELLMSGEFQREKSPWWKFWGS